MIFVQQDMEVLFFMKNGSARGVNYAKIRGARGVLFMHNTPRDMDNIGKKCRPPLIYTH